MRLPVGPGDIFRPVAHGFMGDIVLFAVRQPGKATGPPCVNYVVFFAQASIVYLALSFSSRLQTCSNPKGVKFSVKMGSPERYSARTSSPDVTLIANCYAGRRLGTLLRVRY